MLGRVLSRRLLRAVCFCGRVAFDVLGLAGASLAGGAGWRVCGPGWPGGRCVRVGLVDRWEELGGELAETKSDSFLSWT